MIAQSSSDEISPGKMDCGIYRSDDNYLPVSVHIFISRCNFPCNLLVPARSETGEVELKEVIKEGQAFDDSVIRLLDQGISHFYVRSEDEGKILEFLRAGADNIMLSNSYSIGEKCRIIYSYAESVVRRVFRERPNSDNIRLGREVVANMLFMLSSGRVTPKDLTSAFSDEDCVFSHSARVTILGMAFSNFLKMPKNQILDFGMGALFHDIGKSPTENRMLADSSRWNIEEFEVLKKHATVGYRRILSTQSMTEEQLDIILHHHEAHDGSGYPAGLKGDQIGELSRIARIVDCYDTITTKRQRKKALCPSDAVALMSGDMKDTFNPVLLGSFRTFMGMEEEMTGAMDGKRVNIEMGSQMHIQLSGEDVRFKTVLIGIDALESIIVRSPASAQIRSQLYEGRPIVAKCVQSGSVYGFRSKVLCNVLHPNVRMLIMAYPSKIETINLRKNPRICCYLPVELNIEGMRYNGVIVDLSLGGCRLVVKSNDVNSRVRAKIDGSLDMNIPAFGDDGSDLFSGEIKNINLDENTAKIGISFLSLSERNNRNLEQYIGSILDVVSTNDFSGLLTD